MNNTNITLISRPTYSRFHPATWSTGKKIVATTVAAVFAIGGWALFRPELLFVNQTVSETLPTSGQNAPALISQGQFTSLAHHTEGSARLYNRNQNGYVLRLADFSTSNGPDVHVYAVEGRDGTDNAKIKNGQFLDLGTLKGNIGDQNYTLPANFDPQKYESVSIWCKRFGVNFAGAALQNGTSAPRPALVAAPQMAPVSTNDAKSVTVTTGQFHKVGEGVQGNATIKENSQGQRTLTLTNFSSAKGPDLHLYLVKAEDVKDSTGVKKAGFIDLGKLKSLSGMQIYAVPKNIDLWQYLAVTVWCNKFKVNFATAPLASPQN
ncbi:hypothetical protein IAD21_05544 [Abditibacteriota bacterium]|nr:hypothetical protein IAD21_05544 [Abditibacteriota bacterium]